MFVVEVGLAVLLLVGVVGVVVERKVEGIYNGSVCVCGVTRGKSRKVRELIKLERNNSVEGE